MCLASEPYRFVRLLFGKEVVRSPAQRVREVEAQEPKKDRHHASSHCSVLLACVVSLAWLFPILRCIPRGLYGS